MRELSMREIYVDAGSLRRRSSTAIYRGHICLRTFPCEFSVFVYIARPWLSGKDCVRLYDREGLFYVSILLLDRFFPSSCVYIDACCLFSVSDV